ncbi:MAG: SBBP repeat-containing protein [Candidatus Cloacimonetes bacterium]|nr:SBBP repeat-containing protein [Candidatus Cloacimonadota bacterium]
MKKLLIIFALAILSSIIYCQTSPDWFWVKQAGGIGVDSGQGIASDSNGNIYNIGSYNGNATFGATTLTSNGIGYSDIFISKQDRNGNYLWAKKAGGASWDGGAAIATDSSGNIYVTGYFSNTITFGTTTLTSSGSTDIFIAKLDSNGSYLWAVKAGGTGNDMVNAIANDGNGNSYVIGIFYGTAYFGGSVLISSGGSDIFIYKLGTNGNGMWATKAGGASYDAGYAITTGSNGNSYVTGSFDETATFGTTSLTSSGSYDIFIAKLDSNGNYLWAKKAGGTSSDSGNCIATDSSGNSYVTGYFHGTATFGANTLTSSGSNDIFITKLNANGTYLWARKAGGTSSDFGKCIATNAIGNSCIVGNFAGTATFGTSTLTSSGSYDIFLAKLDTNGNYFLAKKAGGASEDNCTGVTTDATGNNYVTGYFQGSITFGTTSLTSSGDWDIFIAKGATDSPYLDFAETPIDFGVEYLGYNATYNLWLRNIGVEPLRVDSLSFWLTSTPFEVIGLTLPFEITEGDSAAIEIRFTPMVAGTVTDSLIVYNNSINLPRAAIRLSGTGQYVPPLPPENVNLVMDGSNAIISWNEVTETVLHTPIEPDYYLVFFKGLADDDAPYYFLGATPSLQYTHYLVGLHSPYMFYRVRAYKDNGRGEFDFTSLGLVPGMREDEVLGLLEVKR